MDVLYILGSGSKWGNRELRYSLRSLERFARGVGRVFVVGENPGFLSSEVTYRYVPDTGPRSWNHASKVIRTFCDTDISDRVLLNYDDNFLLSPIDAEHYPHYFRGELPVDADAKPRHPGYNSRMILEAAGRPCLDFGVHCPMIYERSEFLNLIPIFERTRARGNGMSIRSVYANWYRKTPVFMKDCKVGDTKNPVECVEDIEMLAEDRHVVSIHDRSIENGMAQFLERMFPAQSRYETMDGT